MHRSNMPRIGRGDPGASAVMRRKAFSQRMLSCGFLLVISAHLQHAVMPRALRRAPTPLSVLPWALSLRISVAMNVYVPGTFGPGAFCFGGVIFSR